MEKNGFIQAVYESDLFIVFVMAKKTTSSGGAKKTTSSGGARRTTSKEPILADINKRTRNVRIII
jgi:hypothetical protein